MRRREGRGKKKKGKRRRGGGSPFFLHDIDYPFLVFTQKMFCQWQ